MGILTRFKDIMSSNINALLDKAEDPEKMVDQCLRNLNSDLGKVKAETAEVMANEQRAKRELDECTNEINKIQNFAAKAVAAGNDDDARKFLEKKQTLVAKQTQLQQSYDMAHNNAQNMRAMSDKLVKDIASLEERRDNIKAKMNMAKTQEHINKLTSNTVDSSSSMDAFERMEKKADKMLDTANAMAELNKASASDEMAELEAKYSDSAPGNSAVEDELAALKASLMQ